MTAYWIVALLTMLLNRILRDDSPRYYARNLMVSFIPLFIYGAIRVDFGNDYSSYELFFDEFHFGSTFKADTDAHAEVGYQYLCYLMPSYRSILILNAFLLALSFGYFIYKNIPTKYAWLAILLIFLMPEKNIFGSLVGIRNGLVVSCLLLSFTFIQQRKYYLILPIAFLLSLIHTSAIAYIPLAYIVARNTSFTKRELVIWCILGVVFILVSTSSLVGIMMPVISLVAGRYEEQLVEINDASRGLLNYTANLIMMIVFITFAYKRDADLSSNQKSLLRMAALYCVSGFLGALSGRMTYFFAVYYIGGVVLMYSLPWKNKLYKNLILGFVLLIACYATFFVWMRSEWWNHDVYHSILGDL